MLVKRFEGDCQFSDLDIAINTITDLLVTNDEIFERCKKAMPSQNNAQYKEKHVFVKDCFRLVKVWRATGTAAATQISQKDIPR